MIGDQHGHWEDNFKDLRKKALTRLQRRRPDLSGLDTGDMKVLVHELEVHQVELEVQNEELRRTQSELIDARDAYLDLYEFAPAGYLSVNDDGTIRRLNLTAATLMGEERAKLMGRRVETLIIPEDRDACYRLLRESAAENASRTKDLRRVCPDGRVIWLNATAVPVRDVTDAREGFRVTLFDVTARREAEAALQQSEATFRSLIAESFDGIIIIDHEGKIVEWNKGEVQITGISREQAMGAYLWDVQYRLAPREIRTPAFLETARKKLLAALEEGAYLKRTIEDEIEREDGARRIVQSNIFAVRIGGKLLACGICRDVTRRRQEEKALARYRDELEVRVAERTAEAEARAEAMGRLALELSRAEDAERRHIAAILHDDLQQYLASMRFRLGSLVPEDQMNEKLAGRLSSFEQIIDEAIGKCRTLSHELSPPVLAQNGLLAALNWLARDMKENHGIDVSLHTAPEAEPESPALASALYRSVRELLFNIVKHAGIHEAKLDIEETGGQIRIRIHDSGRGFDLPELRNRQANDDGFGLFAVEERIGFLGGTFEITTAPGQGCRIELSVPREIRPHPDDGEEPLSADFPEARVEKPSAGPEITAKPDKIRILLADDHAVMRQGLAGILENQADFEVVAQAENGRQAVHLAEQTSPDVILMDISMPGMDGIEATAEIIKTHPETRIIGLSMHDDDSTKERMRQAGAAAFIYKAESTEKLAQAVRSVVDGGK